MAPGFFGKIIRGIGKVAKKIVGGVVNVVKKIGGGIGRALGINRSNNTLVSVQQEHKINSL